MDMLIRIAGSRVWAAMLLFIAMLAVSFAFAFLWERHWDSVEQQRLFEEQRRARIAELRRLAELEPEPEKDILDRTIRFERDGSPRILITRYRSNVNFSPVLTTLDGTPVPMKPEDDWLRLLGREFTRIGWEYGPDSPAKYGRRAPPKWYRSFRWGWKLEGNYFYMTDRGWIAHYDQTSRLPDLYLSPSGMRDSPPAPDDRFGKAVWSWLGDDHRAIVDEGRVYILQDKAPRHSHLVHTARTQKLGVTRFYRKSAGRKSVTYFLVVDGNDIIIINNKYVTLATITLPEGFLSWDFDLTFVNEDDSGPYIVWRDAYSEQPGRAYIFDGQGKQTATYQWPDWEEQKPYVSAPIPEKTGWSFGRKTAVGGLLVISLLSAGFIFSHARRHYLTRVEIVAWTAFVIATGLAGLVAYFAMRDFSLLVNCSSCEGRRPVDRIACPRCGSDFDRGELIGIEIIDPV